MVKKQNYLSINYNSFVVSNPVEHYKSNLKCSIFFVIRCIVLPINILLLLLFLIWLILVAILLNIVYLGNVRKYEFSRGIIMKTTKFSCDFILYVIGIDIVCDTAENIKLKNTTIVVSNHLSYIDHWIIFSVFNGILAPVIREDYLIIPGLNILLKTIGAFGVNRKSKTGCTMKLKKRLDDNEWPPLLCFPEATTTNGSGIISFRTGVFVNAIEIQPVTLRYATKSGFDIAWTDQKNTILHFLRLLCEPNKKVFVNIAEIKCKYNTSTTNYMENIRNTMINNLECSMIEYTCNKTKISWDEWDDKKIMNYWKETIKTYDGLTNA